MDLIPDWAFREVERRRRRRGDARAREARLLQDAVGRVMGSPGLDRIGSPGTPASDKVGREVVRKVAAETQEAAWEDVFREADEHFGADSDAVKVARLVYDEQLSQAQTAEALKCDRQTVRRQRDAYVIYSAFVASGRGLMEREGQNIE